MEFLDFPLFEANFAFAFSKYTSHTDIDTDRNQQGKDLFK